MLHFKTSTILRFSFRFFFLIFIVGIFFGVTNVFAIEQGSKSCGTPTSNCPCRTNPSGSYSSDSNGGTARVGASTRFINGYFVSVGQNDGDKIKCDPFTSRYSVSYSNPRGIQQKINKLAEYGNGCSPTCEDGRFGNDTIAKMQSCMCADASGSMTNGTCAAGLTGDGAGCCIAVNCSDGEKMPLNSSQGCDDPNFVPDGAGCCLPNCTDPKKPANTPDCSDLQGYKYENGCCVSSTLTERETRCNLTAGTLNDTTVSCIEQEGTKPCCIDSGCWNQLTPGQTKPNLEFCPTCSTGQVGTQSGASRSCKTCEPGTAPNLARTKCVCSSSGGNCCGIKLNTVVPFIGDCIEMSNDDSAPSAGNTTRVNALNAFPILMGSLSKILVTAILIFSFVMVVVGGVMIISGGINESNFKTGKDIIYKVIMALALLGASGIILRLINPNFFG